MSAAIDSRRQVEYLDVIAWRYDEAKAAGLRHEDAEAFAYSGIDIGALRKLVSVNAPPEMIAAILL